MNREKQLQSVILTPILTSETGADVTTLLVPSSRVAIPAGRIGKRLILRVADVAKQNDIPLVTGDQKVMYILVELSSKGKGCVLVLETLEGKKLLGTFTDGDLRRSLEKLGEAALKTEVKELMSGTPRVVKEEAMAVDAMTSMKEPTKVTFLPVVDDGQVVTGLVTLHDLVSAGI